MRTSTQATVGSGVGAAIGVAIVILVPKLTSLTWTTEEAAIMTGALGTICAWLVRYLPSPS